MNPAVVAEISDCRVIKYIIAFGDEDFPALIAARDNLPRLIATRSCGQI